MVLIQISGTHTLWCPHPHFDVPCKLNQSWMGRRRSEEGIVIDTISICIHNNIVTCVYCFDYTCVLFTFVSWKEEKKCNIPHIKRYGYTIKDSLFIYNFNTSTDNKMEDATRIPLFLELLTYLFEILKMIVSIMEYLWQYAEIFSPYNTSIKLNIIFIWKVLLFNMYR